MRSILFFLSAMSLVNPVNAQGDRRSAVAATDTTIVEGNTINVQRWGATGNGTADDWDAIQKAIDHILRSRTGPRTLFFPPGSYKISKPLIIAVRNGLSYGQASINLSGPTGTKNISAGFASINPTFNNSFAIGIQSGKGIEITNLAILGRFTFPNSLNRIQVDTLAGSEWTDGSSRDKPYSPYAGIVIDPFSDPSFYKSASDMYPGLQSWYLPGMNRGGSTSIQLRGCAVRNFIVGVMITPSNQQNGELIDVIDCDLGGNKVGYAMGQAQSKECHVQRLMCWMPTYTLFDNGSYGFKHGDGAAVPFVDGVNIASAVHALCRIYASSFGGSFRNVYAEGLFKLGFVGGPATVSFEDCQLDFMTNEAGLPYPDFYVLGSGAVFENCMFRLYPGVPGARVLLSGTSDVFNGGVTNAPPVAVNLTYNTNFGNPHFNNVLMYYSGGILGNSNKGSQPPLPSLLGSNAYQTDPVYFGNSYLFRDPSAGVDITYKTTYDQGYERTVQLSGMPVVHTNRSTWTAVFKLGAAADANLLRPGDFILTRGLHYPGDYKEMVGCTNVVGIIRSIGHDTVYLDNLGLGIRDGALSLWADYFVNANAPMTGDIDAGSNRLVKVQGRFPDVGERLDMPMLPSGTFVTAVDAGARTITFSNRNMTGRAFNDYTFINGYPKVEIYSNYGLPELQQFSKTLIGGADFYQMDLGGINTHDRDFPLNGMPGTHFQILHTNILGDTTLHKLRYRLISVGKDGAAPVVVTAAAGISATVAGNDAHLRLVIHAAAPFSGEIVRVRWGYRWGSAPVSVISAGNAFSGTNTNGLYCEAEGLTGLAVGGRLQAAGDYVFDIQTGQ